MKVKIEIWQNIFNSEWSCDITTNTSTASRLDETEHWAVEDFCALLKLLGERFPGAKCVALDKSVENLTCEHIFEPIPESYDACRCSYRARCVKCKFVPD